MALSRLRKYVTDHSYNYLAVTLALFLILPPFLRDVPYLNIIILILTTLVIISCIFIITGFEKFRPVHILYILILVIPWFTPHEHTYLLGEFLVFAILFGLTSYRVIIEIVRIKVVNTHVIVGSVVAYLLMGLSFSMICAALSTYYPDAYNAPESYNQLYNFVYYAFVTLTTLGYGDVVPLIPQSQALSLFIAVTGQFYMVIIVATLVGKYLQNQNT